MFISLLLCHFALWAASSCLFLFRWCGWVHAVEVAFESIQVRGPKPTVLLDPGSGVFEWPGIQAAGTPLRLAAAQDQSGALKHLQMLRDRGHGHLEWFSEFGHRGLAQSQPGQDGASSGVGECGESRAEQVLHVINQSVK